MVGGLGVRVGGKLRLFVGGYVDLLAHLSLFPLLPRGQDFPIQVIFQEYAAMLIVG